MRYYIKTHDVVKEASTTLEDLKLLSIPNCTEKILDPKEIIESTEVDQLAQSCVKFMLEDGIQVSLEGIQQPYRIEQELIGEFTMNNI